VRVFGSTCGAPPRTTCGAPPRTCRSAPPSRAPAVARIAEERTDRYAAPSGTTTTAGGSPARGKRRECLARGSWCVRSLEGGGSEPARISKEDGTEPDVNGDDTESEPGASQSGESLPMPRAGERALLGPGHSALHQRVLRANVGWTADEPHRLRAPEKRTLGPHRTHPRRAPRVTQGHSDGGACKRKFEWSDIRSERA
jgi:hypothetical protein